MTKHSEPPRESIHTKIWDEVPETDNPFAAKICYCSGYDVYGDLLGKISWVEYLYLLFKLEKPTEEQAKLLEGLAIILANPGPRDHSVRAAMNAGVGGSTNASILMAAAAVGAGNLAGGREVFLNCDLWGKCENNFDAWKACIENPKEYELDTWQEMEHVPGYDPNGINCPAIVKSSLSYLSDCSQSTGALTWLRDHRVKIEEVVGYPLALSGVASAALVDLGFFRFSHM